MEKQSVEKLLSAGYVFLRTEDSTNTKCDEGVKYVIKCSSDFGNWRKHSEYTTKAARKRELERLVQGNNKYLY